MHETHWAGLSRPSWEWEMDLHLSRQQILLHWAGTPNHHRQTNRLYSFYVANVLGTITKKAVF